MEGAPSPRLADRPAPRGALPPARATIWREWRRSLCTDLDIEEHCVPTPSALWRLLHGGGAAPRGATWEDLLRGADEAGLRAAIARSGAVPGGGLASWNVRWIVDPGNDKAALVRAVLDGHVGQGVPVLLQETHWDEAAAAVWGGGVFPHTDLAHSAARPGPHGGPQGGVAVLVPEPLTLRSAAVLVPGCAVAADVAKPGGDRCTYVSLYLPPGQQGEAWAALHARAPPPPRLRRWRCQLRHRRPSQRR